MRLRAVGISDTGKVRSSNEDCFGIDLANNVVIVADGMGGHSYGEIASRIAVKTIQDFISRTADQDSTWPFAYDARIQHHSNRLQMAIRIAQDKIRKAIEKEERLRGMGTTVVSMMLKGNVAVIAHVGDSRAYRFRDGKLELLTSDHTWVNEQIALGNLSEEQAREHPFRNVVTKALGGEGYVSVDVREETVVPGDLFLLCSDGLTGMLEDKEIEDYLAKDASLEEKCKMLVDAANERGGTDNVTVVLAVVEEE